jgi:two-component system, OmpR family, response regulator
MAKITATELQRILLVEDETDIQIVARLALEALGGFEVEVCASGDQAVAMGLRFRPQLILLDFMMPGMDGRKTFQALGEVPDLAGIPVVFMTARAQLDEVEEYRALGAVDVIIKPFDPMTLADQIRQTWLGLSAAVAQRNS